MCGLNEIRLHSCIMCAIRKCIFLSPIALSLPSAPGKRPNAQDKSRAPRDRGGGTAAKRKQVSSGGVDGSEGVCAEMKLSEMEEEHQMRLLV